MNEEHNIQASAYQKYDVSVSVITIPQWITSNCADIAFVNTSPQVGGATAIVKGFPLIPGQYISITANDGELDETQYEIKFGAGITACTVIRKIYKKD